ncbi:MAG: glycosyltransferase [Lachnospiraceae bacterium]|nr:glycosyltransferase [Lachnospiraceae bacterium]
MNIKVSVITPCLNSEKTIRGTIESVLGQTYDNIEYILVDGGSADRTVEIMEEYRLISSGRLQYISEKDKGIYDAMNKGIIRASGDLIGIINSDDWYEPDAVGKAVHCFMETGADVVYGEMWVVGENGMREYHTSHSTFPPHPSTFIKREAYRKYGMFDLDYQIASDRDLLLRFITAGAHFQHIDAILSNFRKTGISSVNRMGCAEESYSINLKYLGNCPESILTWETVEEKYSRDKLVYISCKAPEVIKSEVYSQPNIKDGLAIFGAGTCGKELDLILERCGIPVRFFVDNEEKKWGLELNGTKIFSPEILRYGKIHIIVTTSRFQEDICKQLRQYSNPGLTWSVLEDIRKNIVTQWDRLSGKFEPM